MHLVRWSCEHALYRIQEALLGVIENFPVRWIAGLMRLVVFPLGARFRPPSDRVGGRVARELLEDRDARLHLTADIFVPAPHEPGLGMLDAALDRAVGAIPIETKLRDLVRAGQLDRSPGYMLDDHALAAGLITQAEYDHLNAARDARDEVIQVDAFDFEEYKRIH